MQLLYVVVLHGSVARQAIGICSAQLILCYVIVVSVADGAAQASACDHHGAGVPLLRAADRARVRVPPPEQHHPP